MVRRRWLRRGRPAPLIGLSLRRAPLGFARFKEMVDSDFYKGVRFFRVIDGFMAQFVRSLLPAFCLLRHALPAPEDVH